MNTINNTKMLEQMQQLASKARGETAGLVNELQSKQSFGDMLSSALSDVNALQNKSGEMKNRFVLGDPKVSLVDAMVAKEKSGVAFEATLQVRNRLVKAYQDIMSMPI